MALAALFSIIVAGTMAYKMMVKHEPIDIMKLFKPLVVSVILCWWYPPADTGITNSGNEWCVLDFLSYIPNCIGSYTHDLYEAESAQIEDKFEEVQELIYTRDTLCTSLQAQADVAHSGTSDPNLIESTMEQAGVDEVTNMETDASRLWFTSLTAGAVVGIDKIIMLIALIVFRIGWWATIYCQQILLGMLTIFGPIQWAFSLLPKWEGAWAKWLIRYLTVHFYGAMLYFVSFRNFLTLCKSDGICFKKCLAQQTNTKSVPIKFLSYQRWYTATETQCKGNKNNRQSFLFIPLFYPRNLFVGFTERLSFVLTRLEQVHEILINRTCQNFNSMISTEKSYFQVNLSQISPARGSIFLSPNFLSLTLQSEFQRHVSSQQC